MLVIQMTRTMDENGDNTPLLSEVARVPERTVLSESRPPSAKKPSQGESLDFSSLIVSGSKTFTLDDVTHGVRSSELHADTPMLFRVSEFATSLTETADALVKVLDSRGESGKTDLLLAVAFGAGGSGRRGVAKRALALGREFYSPAGKKAFVQAGIKLITELLDALGKNVPDSAKSFFETSRNCVVQLNIISQHLTTSGVKGKQARGTAFLNFEQIANAMRSAGEKLKGERREKTCRLIISSIDTLVNVLKSPTTRPTPGLNEPPQVLTRREPNLVRVINCCNRIWRNIQDCSPDLRNSLLKDIEAIQRAFSLGNRLKTPARMQIAEDFMTKVERGLVQDRSAAASLVRRNVAELRRLLSDI